MQSQLLNTTDGDLKTVFGEVLKRLSMHSRLQCRFVDLDAELAGATKKQSSFDRDKAIAIAMIHKSYMYFMVCNVSVTGFAATSGY